MNRYVLVLDVPPLPIFPNSYMLDSLKFPKKLFVSSDRTTYNRVVRERYHIEALLFTSPVWAT